MGIGSFLLKSKIKKIINEYLINATIEKSKIKILFKELYDLNYFINLIADDYANGRSVLPIEKRIEIFMVAIAEKYMDELLIIESGGIISEKDFAKLHFCIAVMTSIIRDQWPSIEGKLIKLNLWHKHWRQIDLVGSNLTRQAADVSPTIVILFVMISANLEDGILYLSDDFPFDEIRSLVMSKYNV